MRTKFFSIALLVAVAFTLSSCKKDYVCLCTFEDSSGDEESESVIYTDVTKKAADDACDQNAAGLLNYGYQNVECNVK